jgi:hypothetical protein
MRIAPPPNPPNVRSVPQRRMRRLRRMSPPIVPPSSPNKRHKKAAVVDGRKKKNYTMNATPQRNKRPRPITSTQDVQTSRNNPALAQKIQEVSARIIKENYELYKDLENK